MVVPDVVRALCSRNGALTRVRSAKFVSGVGPLPSFIISYALTPRSSRHAQRLSGHFLPGNASIILSISWYKDVRNGDEWRELPVVNRFPSFNAGGDEVKRFSQQEIRVSSLQRWNRLASC